MSGRTSESSGSR